MRGQLSRLRNQYFTWTTSGLQTSKELDRLMHEAHRSFRSAVLRTEAPETSGAAALLSMDMSAKAVVLLCRHYTEQRLTFRKSRSGHLPVFLGCHLDRVPEDEEAFLQAFNAVLVDTPWAQLEPSDGTYTWDHTDALVEWALEHRMSIMGGPLVDLSTPKFPGWLESWSGDLVNLQSFTSDYVETVVGRYVGRIRHWEVVAGANCGGVGQLNEEQRLNMVVRAVEAARQVDEHVQISLRIIQPWGEYLSQTRNRLSPIQFADTLRRCGVNLAEINLDVRIQDSPRKTLPRDSLSFSQLLDHWAALQLPINVMLTVPRSFEGDDPDFESEQAEWLQAALLMSLSKDRVAGVYYLNWRDWDSDDGQTGLKRKDGSNRPSLEMLQEARRSHWGV
ncbi:MAG: endo-1,4-beta-xylanase [Planctomycetaceae bacterium]